MINKFNKLIVLCLDIKSWIAKKNLKDLPLPKFYGFGSALYNNNKYRFIVIEKFDKDLETFLKTVSNNLLLGAVINIVRQIVSNFFLYSYLVNQINFLFFYF